MCKASFCRICCSKLFLAGNCLNMVDPQLVV
uniref:Uncharacterized protein n=1 Tax=Rhizophora mucronata TaxID=61149 RepID=A0A2P2PX27_RHIMU